MFMGQPNHVIDNMIAGLPILNEERDLVVDNRLLQLLDILGRRIVAVFNCLLKVGINHPVAQRIQRVVKDRFTDRDRALIAHVSFDLCNFPIEGSQ